jgi:hypothetical protein
LKAQKIFPVTLKNLVFSPSHRHSTTKNSHFFSVPSETEAYAIYATFYDPNYAQLPQQLPTFVIFSRNHRKYGIILMGNPVSQESLAKYFRIAATFRIVEDESF